MIIVSNETVNKPASMHLSYETFVEKAYSDDGLDMDDGLALNINDVQSDVFNDLNGIEGVALVFFTLNGNFPSFANGVKIEDWSGFTMKSDQSSFNETPILDEPDEAIKNSIVGLLDEANYGDDADTSNSDGGKKDARIIVFGSSKGGTGKTFTSIISTYRYAKTHPDERIALVDFDIIDGQVGISIHKVRPTVGKYYTEYQKGYRDFKTMKNFAVKANNIYPQNVDFYLAPSGATINNNDFWLNVLQNCIENYDIVVFDTGIDYLNIVPISYVYKAADKINLVTTTSIKSVNSVTKQIGRLKGEIKSPGRDEDGSLTDFVFNKEDEIAPKLNIIITQMVETNNMNKTIYKTLSDKCNVIATFGVITDSVSQAEFYGRWDIFDKNAAINKSLDDIMS